MAEQFAAADTHTDEEYNASIVALMDKIGVACDGALLGLTACALFNCLCHVASQTTPEMRKVMLESASELVSTIEAIDAPKH